MLKYRETEREGIATEQYDPKTQKKGLEYSAAVQRQIAMCSTKLALAVHGRRKRRKWIDALIDTHIISIT